MPKYKNATKAISFDRRPQPVNARNVLQPKHTIPLAVRRLFTDVNGTVIDKATVPLALQTRYPVFLLGEFDRQGGFAVGRKIIAPDEATPFYQAFVNGMGATSQSVTGVSGLNDIQQRLSAGDLVLVYTDDIETPNYFVWFIIKHTAGSYASVLSNSMSMQNDSRLGNLFVYEIVLRPDTDAQLSQDLHFTRYDNIGNFTDNQIQPLGIYRSIMDYQNDLIRLKTTFNITQFLGINFYMLFDCDYVTFDLNILKIN